MSFNHWIDTLNQEKNLNMETLFEVEGESGPNLIPAAVVVEHIKIAPNHEQKQIKKVLVMIDFKNGDVMDFYKHLAGAIAI